MNDPVLKIENLTTRFSTRRGMVTAVNGVSLALNKGETLGIVGESGCGKSVTALSILQLLPGPAARITDGTVRFNGEDLLCAGGKRMKEIRGNEISMIFQEPMTSLNPVYTAGYQIMEVIRKHRKASKKQAREEAIEMLRLVGIPEPELRVDDYPHLMSGGMRQRVMIAMALACRPQVMIADEPTTALDVTIQAQILELMNRLAGEIGMAMLLITHDLGVVAETCDRVMVMYAGRVVEEAPVGELFKNPGHPYTKGLFDSLPNVGAVDGYLKPIPGTVPALTDLPEGCPFLDRCFQMNEKCRMDPPWLETGQGHRVRCLKPVERI